MVGRAAVWTRFALERALWWTVLHRATIGFAILAVALLVGLYRVETTGRVNHRVLCALEEDVRQRRDAGQDYLDEHPMGVVSPKTGAVIFTPAELQKSIDNQTATLRALRRGGLRC